MQRRRHRGEQENKLEEHLREPKKEEGDCNMQSRELYTADDSKKGRKGTGTRGRDELRRCCSKVKETRRKGKRREQKGEDKKGLKKHLSE